MRFSIFTIKTILKDRLFLMILSFILVYGFIPFFSYFSMRQLQEISITMSISLNSFILLILSLFGSIYTIWRDIERKYTFTMLSYPVTRVNYIIGRYLGFVIILLIITLINLGLGAIAIKISAGFYKSQLPIMWSNIIVAYLFSFLKYSIVLAFGFLFASFSTSFFTPVFSTIAIFLAGNSIQGIYDYILKESDKTSQFLKGVVSVFYYILPNLSAFDMTSYAAYSIKINSNSILFSIGYFFLYVSVVMCITVLIFNKRDLK
ncbi:ABC transporter permease [Deferribacteraceae bacterium V6Fe1]|nr:ABC transporter permease [Deferribacteraceae bacterium V6Fe1]